MWKIQRCLPVWASTVRDRAVSTLDLLAGLLLVLVVALVFGGLAYRHPSAREPLLLGLSGVAVLAAIVGPILTR